MIDETKSAHKPVLIDFYAEWCMPCQTMEPVLNALQVHMKDVVEVIRINVDQYPKAPIAYKVISLPTFLLLINGREVWRKGGLIPRRDLEEMILSAIKQAHSKS
ncbi:MAG: thioredoxin family protein [Chitinophagaceae bacterium]|nr:thioredoxin family protein [Chitinophagaceae bacterium]